MRLLTVANVNPAKASGGGPSDGRWLAGFNRSSRVCSVQIETADPCEAGTPNAPIMGTVNSLKSDYSVRPYSIAAALRQSVSCAEADDGDWFAEAIRHKLEYLAGRGLVTQMHPAVETWIGAAGTQQVTLPGTPTAANWVTAINDAYDLWHTTVADVVHEPLLHIPPRLAPQLQAAGIITITGPEEISSVYSPTVVCSPGYNANPVVFFSSPIVVYSNGMDMQGGPIYRSRLNSYSLQGNEQMAIDVPPCSIVRLGAAS